jgi:hypothetical protein
MLSNILTPRRASALVCAVVAATTVATVGMSPRAQTRATGSASASSGRPIKVLVIGNASAAAELTALAASLARRGIQLTVATTTEAAAPDRLAHYDAVLVPGTQKDVAPDVDRAVRPLADKGRVIFAADPGGAGLGSPAAVAEIEKRILAAVDDPVRAAWKQLGIPDTVYVDGLPVPNYEARDPAPRYQLPLSVQESMKFIQTPAEFAVTLFASEPDIVKPIAFNFDERGRMWLQDPRGHQRRR